jgi:Zn-dependent M16 (insulinase) family peptidase
MSRSERLPEPLLSVGETRHGFLVERVAPVEEVRAMAYVMVHEKSGARLLHLHAEDTENLLAIAFRTPPMDDTGLPHILEHTVLCGSRRFPVKDPFVELLKSSLATFLNAMTYPDKTVYPCASMLEKDFFNLARVYCDSVFHPLLTERHFKQEGHHLELAEPGNPDSDLIIKGIVFNEMKGAYSDLDGLIERMIYKGLFPDNAYGRDPGGDPDVIPKLTYEEFVEYHRRYYHPSNSYIFIYGGIPCHKHLEFLDGEYLCEFQRIRIDSSISPQPRWTAPRRQTVPYPIGLNEAPQRKAAVVISFFTNPVTDALCTLSLHVLDQYLLGNAASPLRKALIDSRLGEELTGSGYSSSQRDTFFTVGLKGTEAHRAEAIEELVLSTLGTIVREGLRKDMVDSAFHRLEIASREIQGLYPLQLMERVYRSWLYDADPLHNLRLNEHLAELRRLMEAEKGFLERQLRQMILDNPHYTVLTFLPDQGLLRDKEESFRTRMRKIKEAMTAAELERVKTEAMELEAMQSSPNPPEALATLPRLALSDIPAEPQELNTCVEEVRGIPFLRTDLFSNGLSYLHLAFDLRGLEEDLVDYLPIYAEALRKMGAGEDDYVVMAEREAASTGGVGVSVSANGHVQDPTRVCPFFTVWSKALDSKLPDMLRVLWDRVLRCNLADMKRLEEVVLQGRVALRSQVVPDGWHYALLYAGRNISRNASISERIGGVTQIRLRDRLANDFQGHRDELLGKLERIREFMLARGRVTVSFVGSEDQLPLVRDQVEALAAELRDEVPADEPPGSGSSSPVREAIATPADVAFVAKVLPVVGACHEDSPVLLLLSVHLSYAYLWNEVRVKGGAYGARASYDPLNATFSLASYRDPFVKETLDAFDGVVDYIEERMDRSPAGVEQGIIGTLKTLDRPIRPGQAVGTALMRHLHGETREFRRAFRARLLSLTGEDLLRAGTEILEPAFRSANICVISSRERLAEANRLLGPEALEISDL